MNQIVEAKIKLTTFGSNWSAQVATISQPITQRLKETSNEVKVEEFEEEKEVIVTPKMLLALYDEELVKL